MAKSDVGSGQVEQKVVGDKDAFCFAAVGVSDAPPYPALAALGVFAALAFWDTTELLRRGHKLRY